MHAPSTSLLVAALLWGAALLAPGHLLAASCCGGGSAVSLLVPAYARGVADLSFDWEQYDGYWNQHGRHVSDPPGSDLNQYRVNLGYAHRFAERWQGSILLPYVWNDNRYSGVSSKTDGLGDATLAIWYEALRDESTWKVRSGRDLIPGVTAGIALLVPTGISPYDDVKSSFDVTGRGFYRLDGNLLVEKTIQPFSASLALAYGTYFERSVNREYGKYVKPYNKDLGDRASASFSLGYTQVLGTGGDSLTATAAYSWLDEDDCSYNGVTDNGSGFAKQSAGITLAYANVDSDWSVRGGWNHAIKTDGWGRNFPTTDIFTLGVRYVFR